MTDETPQTENDAAGGQSRAGEAGANLTAVLCADDDHDWEYYEDWVGDPGVINGTYKERWLECSICGATKPATYEDAPSFDDDF